MHETPNPTLLPFEENAVFLNQQQPQHIDCPPRRPRSARFVAEICMFADTAANQRFDAYWLSLNRSRTLWLLWLEFLNECDGGTESFVYAYMPRKAVQPQAAARALLACGWRAEFRNGWLPKRVGSVFRSGMFGFGEIDAICDAVWGAEDCAARDRRQLAGEGR